jgi:zinc transporter
MDSTGGLVCAYKLDGAGGGQPLDWDGVSAWTPADGLLWVHLDYAGAEAIRWLRHDSGLDHLTAEILLTREVRPRMLRMGDALLVLLRGVNTNPGADPEDMVAIRVWIEPGRIISLRHRNLAAVADLRTLIDDGRGPNSPGSFLAMVSDRLIDRMGPVINELEDEVDALEDTVLSAEDRTLRSELRHFRRTAIALRRYLAPQRDVMARLPHETMPWMDELSSARLREVADRITRYVEDLDEARERAAVTQDELANRIGDQLNRNTYVLTVIAAVFLPPSLLTGLLGVNVGGMPGLQNPWGFAVTVGAILLMGAFEIWAMKKLKWI